MKEALYFLVDQSGTARVDCGDSVTIEETVELGYYEIDLVLGKVGDELRT